MPQRSRAIKVEGRTRAGLERVAQREGVSVETLVERWLTEKLNDDMRYQLLEAADANRPDPRVIVEKKSAVTAYNLRVQLARDGGKQGDARGLWLIIKDDGPERERVHQQAFEAYLRLRSKQPRLFMRGDDRRFNGGVLYEGALLEWPAAKALHAAMGKALKSHR